MKRYLRDFEKLVDIMAKLRSKNGCMWDKEQTHESLVKYLISESKELKLAVKNKDFKNLEEELGDILLQVVFHAQIAKENRNFDITAVINTLNKKLIRRHPHVFGNYKVKTTKDIEEMWKEVKAKEKAGKKKKSAYKKQEESNNDN
ncbi:MAG: nucleotide pyrophosphohydrolase [Endomicrobia bacterium]|nr:nucleotide pyrophosphohydrolase [Endomicrobiia bacterium]